MILEENKVILRKLVASEGKIIVSKTLDEEGNPTVKSKIIYLAQGANVHDFLEVDEY
jgi:ABC-type multidrug transport system ATPase subunit